MVIRCSPALNDLLSHCSINGAVLCEFRLVDGCVIGKCRFPANFTEQPLTWPSSPPSTPNIARNTEGHATYMITEAELWSQVEDPSGLFARVLSRLVFFENLQHWIPQGLGTCWGDSLHIPQIGKIKAQDWRQRAGSTEKGKWDYSQARRLITRCGLGGEIVIESRVFGWNCLKLKCTEL